jgi:hypothetical protein
MQDFCGILGNLIKLEIKLLNPLVIKQIHLISPPPPEPHMRNGVANRT